jgi:hypothetical protein
VKHAISFSERHAIPKKEIPITIRNEAPQNLRSFVVDLYQKYNFRLNPPYKNIIVLLHNIQNNFTVTDESGRKLYYIQDMLRLCEWNIFYEIIEEIMHVLQENNQTAYEEFEEELNIFFNANGIGYKAVDGLIEVRGDQITEETYQRAIDSLDKAGKLDEKEELKKAYSCISHRENPDITGCLQHLRPVVDNMLRTGIPKELNQYIWKTNFDDAYSLITEVVFNYTSDKGSHAGKGKHIEIEQAYFMTAIVSALTNYKINPKNIS